ncbi:MAG TPA: hypothetical protein VF017_06705 [Thermoanaerobaculia bacterium]|nr:hypothetical protein [Thermoanaerobaculia bacterium]
MAAYVDPAAGVVRGNGRAWPFELDPATGTAQVEVDGRPLRLRPLSWREKRNLARFAPAGPELLERMLLQASLGASAGVEIPAAEREGLLALGLWLNAPAEPLLPLESLLLAQVGVEVAQQLHCSPPELDGWPAWEVEATWQVVRGRSAGEGEAPPAARRAANPAGAPVEDDGLTRILIVPDEPAPPEVASTSVGGGILPEVPGTSVGGGILPEVPGTSARRGNLPEMAGTSAGGGSLPEVAGTSARGGHLPEVAGTSVALGGVEDPDAALAALIASMPGFEGAAGWPVALPGLAAPARSGWPEAVEAPAWSLGSSPPGSPGEDLEELFDLLAERLEEAALDQGIDLEG